MKCQGHTLQTHGAHPRGLSATGGAVRIAMGESGALLRRRLAGSLRHILVDYARARHRAKRGGGWQVVPLEDATAVSAERAAEVVALDQALEALAAFDQRKNRVVELRYS